MADAFRHFRGLIIFGPLFIIAVSGFVVPDFTKRVINRRFTPHNEYCLLNQEVITTRYYARNHTHADRDFPYIIFDATDHWDIVGRPAPNPRKSYIRFHNPEGVWSLMENGYGNANIRGREGYFDLTQTNPRLQKASNPCLSTTPILGHTWNDYFTISPVTSAAAANCQSKPGKPDAVYRYLGKSFSLSECASQYFEDAPDALGFYLDGTSFILDKLPKSHANILSGCYAIERLASTKVDHTQGIRKRHCWIRPVVHAGRGLALYRGRYARAASLRDCVRMVEAGSPEADGASYDAVSGDCEMLIGFNGLELPIYDSRHSWSTRFLFQQKKLIGPPSPPRPLLTTTTAPTTTATTITTTVATTTAATTTAATTTAATTTAATTTAATTTVATTTTTTTTTDDWQIGTTSTTTTTTDDWQIGTTATTTTDSWQIGTGFQKPPKARNDAVAPVVGAMAGLAALAAVGAVGAFAYLRNTDTSVHEEPLDFENWNELGVDTTRGHVDRQVFIDITATDDA